MAIRHRCRGQVAGGNGGPWLGWLSFLRNGDHLEACKAAKLLAKVAGSFALQGGRTQRGDTGVGPRPQLRVSAARPVFGGLVWILVASSRVPIPLIQGWVMFVSVFCFVATTTLLILYIINAHGGETSWVTLDAAYNCVAALFYLSASVLEALATILTHDGYTYKQYHENISAVVFSYVATLLYVVHAVFSLIRWKSS